MSTPLPAPTTLTFRDAGLVGANLPPLTGQQTLVGASIQFTSGANSGQIRTITAYDPATGQITVGVALPARAGCRRHIYDYEFEQCASETELPRTAA